MQMLSVNGAFSMGPSEGRPLKPNGFRFTKRSQISDERQRAITQIAMDLPFVPTRTVAAAKRAIGR